MFPGLIFCTKIYKSIIKKQPLGGVPKNRCSYIPGYIQINMNTLILLEQVHFLGGQQSWKIILLSKRTGQLFQEVCIYFFLYVSKISQTVKEQCGSPVLDNLGEQLDFPGLGNIEEYLCIPGM